MRGYSQKELSQFVETYSPELEGAQMQEVYPHPRGIALGFFKQGMYWLTIDLSLQTPMILLYRGQSPWPKNSPKPVSLFLSAHAKNLYFSRMEIAKKWGRVLIIYLKNEEKTTEIEVRLIPKNANLIIRSDGKIISWKKVRELSEYTFFETEDDHRSLEMIHSEWLTDFLGKTNDPEIEWEKKRKKNIEKKKKAIFEIEKQIQENNSQKHYEEAEKFRNLQDFKSMQIAFEKAKQIKGKQAGTLERLRKLKEEVIFLENAKYIQASLKEEGGSQSSLLLKSEEGIRTRQMRLENGVIAYVGHSAKDNLQILRKAKAWDYWLHLKDYPGAHGIIHRNRDQVVNESDFQKVATWVAKMSLKSKSFLEAGKVAVVIVECRYVRPIKGDRLGRVTYAHQFAKEIYANL